MNILKTSKCPTLSSKSRLTYNVGRDDDGSVQLRVHANSGGGFFSQEWIALDAIEQALADVTDGITAVNLAPLLRGKSVNTPAFLLAVLKQEKLLVPMKDKPRRFVWQDPAKFLASLTKKSPR